MTKDSEGIMPNIRTPSKTSKYYLPKHRFLMVYHYCLQYEEWAQEYRAICGLNSVKHDGTPSGTGGGDPTATTREKLAAISSKMQEIEDVVHEVCKFDGDLYRWILQAVTHEHVTYERLYVLGIPCGRKMFYSRRRRFYYLMARKLSQV